MFRASLDEPVFSAGHESLEVRLFKKNKVPWEELLAIPVIQKSLEDYFDDVKKGTFSFHMGNIVREKHEKTFKENPQP